LRGAGGGFGAGAGVGGDGVGAGATTAGEVLATGAGAGCGDGASGRKAAQPANASKAAATVAPRAARLEGVANGIAIASAY
jgi:hypothetical protein